MRTPQKKSPLWLLLWQLGDDFEHRSCRHRWIAEKKNQMKMDDLNFAGDIPRSYAIPPTALFSWWFSSFPVSWDMLHRFLEGIYTPQN